MFEIYNTTDYMDKSVPETSSTNYISGMCALNLSVDGIGADWHPCDCLCTRRDTPRNLMTYGDGTGAVYNTNPIFGDYGIIESAKQMAEWGFLPVFNEVYRANHHRAILDLLYYDMIKYPMKFLKNTFRKPFYTQKATEDFLHTEKDKQIILEMAKLISPFLPEERKPLIQLWIELETPHGYRG